jgi:hypothetical protein
LYLLAFFIGLIVGELGIRASRHLDGLLGLSMVFIEPSGIAGVGFFYSVW